MTLTIDTWVSVSALLAVLLTLGGLVLGQGRSLRGELRSEIGSLREEFRGEIGSVRGEVGTVRREIAELRTELKAEIAAVGQRVDVLDARVYELALEQARHFGHSPVRAVD